MGFVVGKHRASEVRKYLWLVLIILLVYAIAIANFMLVEKKDFSNAVLESACTSLYVNCSGELSLSTKVVHVLLGLSTMAGLVLVISAGVDVFLNDFLGGNKMKKQISSLNGHFIVCGYGALGRTVCSELAENNKSFVVIDKNKSVFDKLSADGVLVIEGDALDASVLRSAGVEKAKRVVSALPDDAGNVFLTLSAKDLNPKVLVATRAFNDDSIRKLHKAGADIVVMPDVVAGLELSREALGLSKSHAHELVSRR